MICTCYLISPYKSLSFTMMFLYVLIFGLTDFFWRGCFRIKWILRGQCTTFKVYMDWKRSAYYKLKNDLWGVQRANKNVIATIIICIFSFYFSPHNIDSLNKVSGGTDIEKSELPFSFNSKPNEYLYVLLFVLHWKPYFSIE